MSVIMVTITISIMINVIVCILKNNIIIFITVKDLKTYPVCQRTTPHEPPPLCDPRQSQSCCWW